MGSNSTFPNFDSRHGHWQNRRYAAPPNLKNALASLARTVRAMRSVSLIYVCKASLLRLESLPVRTGSQT